MVHSLIATGLCLGCSSCFCPEETSCRGKQPRAEGMRGNQHPLTWDQVPDLFYLLVKTTQPGPVGLHEKAAQGNAVWPVLCSSTRDVWPEFLPQIPLAEACKPETSLLQAPRESIKKVRHLRKVIQHSEKCLVLPIDCLGHIHLQCICLRYL